MIYAGDPTLMFVISIALGLLGLLLTFLFLYWVIRLAITHGLRSHARWERSGDL